MNRLIFVTLSLFSVHIFAANLSIDSIKLNSSDVTVENTTQRDGFAKISVAGYELTKKVGTPELPVRTWLLQGTPANIKVAFNVKKTEAIANLRPTPVQPQPCRCETDKLMTFQYNESAYQMAAAPYTLTYLGAFRGTPITRLDVNMAYYDAKSNSTVLRTEADLSVNASEYSFQAAEYKDYLILAPENLVAGTTAFADWKRSMGHNVHVETLLAPTNNLESITAIVHRYYTDHKVSFVIIVGDERAVPMFKVPTSGDYRTPSDLKHYTMDGADDHVPDMFSSRIVATTPEQVEAQLNKSMEFEQKKYENMNGLKRMIGIASNEGANPSDKDYITSIEDRFKSVLGFSSVHLYQNDSQNSNPTVLNSAFNEGALWLTYLGHGSGTSWPSMNRTYATNHIRNMNNRPVVKPIIIDVACMNGKLDTTYLGSSFMKTEEMPTSSPFGAAAYYGGTVNISWHPPAVMARGIAFEHLEKKFKHLGEALLAGQLYLAANWDDQEDVVDNFEWYHLQGDPGMNIEFQ